MRYISLFSGIGGLDLAVRNVLGAETEAYVEIDKFCQKVLRARIKDGYLDDAEIFNDIKEFKWKKTDMVVGGFPCQPFSNAGLRKGETDDRNMWPDTLRVIRMARPEYVFLENVPGLLSGDDEGRQPYVYTVLRQLAEEGFDAEWEIVGADDAGASHRRKRWFCFAYRKLGNSSIQGGEVQVVRKHSAKPVSRTSSEELADTIGRRFEQCESKGKSQKYTCKDCKRIYELADSDNTGDCTHGYRDDSYRQEKDERWEELPLSESRGYYEDQFPNYPPGPSDSSGWEYLLSIMPEIEPAFCRISDDGKMANRMDRLKALGNAVAWQAGAIALRLCIERSGVLDGSAES